MIFILTYSFSYSVCCFFMLCLCELKTIEVSHRKHFNSAPQEIQNELITVIMAPFYLNTVLVHLMNEMWSLPMLLVHLCLSQNIFEKGLLSLPVFHFICLFFKQASQKAYMVRNLTLPVSELTCAQTDLVTVHPLLSV